MKKKLLFVTTILLALSFTVAAADVSGKWVFEQQGRGGTPTKVTLTLKAEGSKLSGNVSQPGRDGANMETEIKEGKVDGNNVSFKVVREFGGNSITTDYSGTLSGDEIKLKITRPGRDGNAMTSEATAKKATT